MPNIERCQVCGDKLEDEDVLTIYVGMLPSEVDENTAHEYYCEECHYANGYLETD